MARVLVTGGAGFIGSHLTHALVQRGDRVRVLDNFCSGKAANLAGIENDIELITGDLRNRRDVLEAVRGVELIFHQAAFVSVPESIEKPTECFATNVDGTLLLLEEARQAGAVRVVLASSAAVYGGVTDLPLRETGATDCLSPYAASKLFDEMLAGLYSTLYGLSVVALRYFNVYGPGQSPDSAYAAAIPKIIARLKAGQAPIVYGDGRQTRDFIYVGDIVRANLLAAGTSDLPERVFNVCSGTETSILDLVDVLSTHFPRAQSAEFVETRPGDVARSVGDASRARSLLGFTPQVGLVDGLGKCVAEVQK